MIKKYRRFKRYSICAKAVLVRLIDGSPEKLTVRVNTISQGGMGFYTDVFLEKATAVSVELMVDSPGGPDIFEGSIASISSQGNDYFTGIAFNKNITYDRFIGIVG
ncbi:MAG: PilZ domain-containing protein [Thermodesulfovibrionales bacterium]